MALKPGIQWGWRLCCIERGCNETWAYWGHSEHWDGGPPPIRVPLPGGWFSYRRGGPTTVHYAYCPKHAELGRLWTKALEGWREARDHVGREAAADVKLGWWTSYWREPTKRERRMAAAIAQEAWEETHPTPLAPWGANDTEKLALWASWTLDE
jgi:hypothetical protein